MSLNTSVSIHDSVVDYPGSQCHDSETAQEVAFFVALEASRDVRDVWNSILKEFASHKKASLTSKETCNYTSMAHIIATVKNAHKLQTDSVSFVPLWNFFNNCFKRLIQVLERELEDRRDSTYDNCLESHPAVYPAQHSLFQKYVKPYTVLELNNAFNGRAFDLPKCIFCLPQLQKLSLSDNQLKSIPADIGRLNRLRTLVLSNNRLKNDSIPYTLSFCTELEILLLDNNALDAIPGFILKLPNLTALHRHGNQNYFRSTFMWYGCETRERIRTASFSDIDVASEALQCATRVQSMQFWSAKTIISMKSNYFLFPNLSETARDYISSVYKMFNICDFCNTASLLHEQGYFVFTFHNPYLGNTCVPFQHWTCSKECALAIEIPARKQQISMARKQQQLYNINIRRYNREVSTIEEDPAPNSLLCGGCKSERRTRGCKIM